MRAPPAPQHMPLVPLRGASTISMPLSEPRTRRGACRCRCGGRGSSCRGTRPVPPGPASDRSRLARSRSATRAAGSGGSPRSARRAGGTRCARVLKQCGHWVMIFLTPMPLRVSTFCMASIWNRYSLPERRAGSPVHRSEGPRMAKSMPARCSSLAVASGHLLVLVVEAAGAAHPVEVLVGERPRCRRRWPPRRAGPWPSRPGRCGQAPRVLLVLHGPVHVAELGREVGLHERQVPAHVEDLVEDLDVDRADLVARLARGARPDLLGGDPREDRVGA